MDVRKIARASVATVGLVLVSAGVYTATRADLTTATFTGVSTIDAAIDAPVDVAIDSAIDAPWSTTWTVETVVSNASSGLLGSDGLDKATISSRLVIISPWEQSGTITVSTRAAVTSGLFTTVNLATVTSVEDAKFCDVDADGNLDIMAGGQGKRIRIWFGPAPWTTSVEIDAATNVQQWMQLACTTTGGARVWAGGRNVTGGVFGYYTSATPRVSSSYTFTQVGTSDWLMSILPGDFDGDGDLDVVISDRQNGQSNKGTRLFKFSAPSTWTKSTIHNSNNEGDPKFAAIVGTDTVFVGMSSSTKANLVKKSVATSAAWNAFTTTTAFTYPINVNQYQAITACDLTGDDVDDYILTHAPPAHSLTCSLSPTTLCSGVIAINGSTSARISIDEGIDALATGETYKYDNALCFDWDGDGDNDVLLSEQNKGLGIFAVLNPLCPAGGAAVGCL